METVEYGGWPNCCKLSNGIVELIITGDVGPRIIRYGFAGGDNQFKEFAEMMGGIGGDEWLIYGGHRFWHAPEEKPRTYYPDNSPVRIEEMGDFVRVVQPVETTTGMQKELDVKLHEGSSRVTVTHRMCNTGLWPVRLAPWALTVLAQGGKVIVPIPPRGSHETILGPTNILTMWAYTDMSDERWTWGEKFIMLRQDRAITHPQKIGVMVPDGWGAYANAGNLFVKKFGFDADADYVDWGCTLETFTNDEMIELESLGPLSTLAPGRAVEHVEDWFLFDGVPVPECDADVERDVMPKVREARV